MKQNPSKGRECLGAAPFFLCRPAWAEGLASTECWRRKLSTVCSSNDQSDVHPRGKLFPGIVIIDSLACVDISITAHPSLSGSPSVQGQPGLGWQLRGGGFSRVTGCFPPWTLLSRGNATLQWSCPLTLLCVTWLQDHWVQDFKQTWTKSALSSC